MSAGSEVRDPTPANPTPGNGTPALADLLGDIALRPTLASYVRGARALEAHRDSLTPVRVALLSSYTIDMFVPYLVVELAREGFAADIHVGAFHSVLQELLDPESGTARHRPDVVVIAQLLDDLSPSLTVDFLAADSATRAAASASVVETLFSALREFRQRHLSAFVVHDFVQQTTPLLGLAEANSEDTRSGAIRTLNEALARAARQMSDVFVLGVDHVCATVGYARWRDDRGWYLGHAPLSAAVSPPLAREHAHVVRALKGAPRKCLVLDLDNTLWGGVVGEDGVAGIRIGDGYPGNVFLDFQRRLLQLHQRGVLLALNSKNNEADVLEVFRSRPELLLGLQHFAAVRLNWQDKPDNMGSIAAELNIGVSSLVFFDDNPAERARMRQVLPEVLTLEVPADPLRYLDVLDEARPFDRLHLSEEDRRRGVTQLADKARRQESASSASLEEFLRGLAMQVTIRPVDAADAPRVLDLLRKTNQFNVTTRRYSAAELEAMLRDDSIGAFSLRAADRFGDHGLVGVALARVDGPVATIDSFLLSCRVIGRGVESALLVQVAEWARAHGAGELVGEFIATAKNAPAAGFYPQHGFSESDAQDGVARWSFDLAQPGPVWPVHIARVSTPGADGRDRSASPDGPSPDGPSPDGPSPDGTAPDGTAPDAVPQAALATADAR